MTRQNASFDRFVLGLLAFILTLKANMVSSDFTPIPGTTVKGPCPWKLKMNTMPNRIPATISEIECLGHGRSCGGALPYQCQQIQTRMDVAYTDGPIGRFPPAYQGNLTVLYKRKMLVGVGCACVRSQASTILSRFAPALIEKRSSFSGAYPTIDLDEYIDQD